MKNFLNLKLFLRYFVKCLIKCNTKFALFILCNFFISVSYLSKKERMDLNKNTFLSPIQLKSELELPLGKLARWYCYFNIQKQTTAFVRDIKSIRTMTSLKKN